MTDLPPTPPAALLPPAALEAFIVVLIPEVCAAAGADSVRDYARVDLACRASVDDVAVMIDQPDPYPDAASMPARVHKACIDLAATYLRRPSSALGVAAYDDLDPFAVRAVGAIRASLEPGLKHRWGFA